jgi:hypothetical protein
VGTGLSVLLLATAAGVLLPGLPHLEEKRGPSQGCRGSFQQDRRALGVGLDGLSRPGEALPWAARPGKYLVRAVDDHGRTGAPLPSRRGRDRPK